MTIFERIDSTNPVNRGASLEDIAANIVTPFEYTPIDGMKTSVSVEGQHKYFIVDPDLNLNIDGKLIPTDTTEIPGTTEDACDKKSKFTKRKCGISNNGKTIGIKRRHDDKQFLVTVSELIGFNDIKFAFSAVSIPMDGYVEFSQDFKSHGIENHCKFNKSLIEDHPFKYYGIKYTVNDMDVLREIKPDDTTKFLEGNKEFIEYFSDEEFKTQDGDGEYGLPYHDYENNYSTVAAGLVSDTTWTTGTYYLTALVLLGVWNLTLDAVGGAIVIKTDTNKSLNPNGTGNLLTVNTSITNKVHFTSKNDNSLGETIGGSSGAPAKGDQDSAYIITTGTGSEVNLDYVEAWYCESVFGIFHWQHTTDRVTNHITLNHITLKYCGIPAGLSYLVSFIGSYRYLKSVGDVDIQNISIDTTNSIKDNAKGYGIYINEAQTLSMQNIYVDIDSTNEAFRGISIVDIETDSTATFKNIFCRCKSAAMCFYIAQQTAHVVTWDVYNCIADNNAGTGTYSFYADRNAGTVTINLYNNIFLNASAGGAAGARTVADTINEGNNGFYNNTANSVGFIPTNPILADPQLGGPGGTIADGYFLPAGFAVGNLVDYEKQGSDTFDNLSIDESIYTMTGLAYAGGDKVTPGCYYEMAVFNENISGRRVAQPHIAITNSISIM